MDGQLYQRAAQRELRWVPGQGSGMTVHSWVLLLESCVCPQFEAVGWGLEYGVRTGRFSCWERGQDGDRFLTADGSRLTAVQARRRLALAAEYLEGDCSTAAALGALQRAWGVRVR